MTFGIGGSTASIELDKIQHMTGSVQPISIAEFNLRIEKATVLMKEKNCKAVYLNAGTNLYYFTGTKWNPSERMVGALLFDDKSIEYILPKFEEGTFRKFMQVFGKINCWEEHQNPYELFGNILDIKNIQDANIAIDESVPYSLLDGLIEANPQLNFNNAQGITSGCRVQKSKNEIDIIQKAHEITLVVQKAAARILYAGIEAKEVIDFIHQAHIKAGISSGAYFCIVLFGDDSQYPHGVINPQKLKDNDIVLIDTGCRLEGYCSDITRTYVFGTPSEEHRKIWNIEKAAQMAVFNAAQLGATCGSVDDAARKVLYQAGFSKNYELPGLPHRVGHGTGLDIHEFPYLVRGNPTVLREGMVVSNEPMICIPGKFGIRHEDHFYMTADGPKWITTPMKSIDDPFDVIESKH